jgi:hypothetical protein
MKKRTRRIKNRPPKGMAFVWLPRDLLESDAWRSQTAPTRRFVDFLLREHLRHGGQRNGLLKAPYRQLHVGSISKRAVTGAIDKAEELGLVVCFRGGVRAATTYRLTWFHNYDGAAAGNEWRAYRNPDLQPLIPGKTRNLPPKRGADGANLPPKRGSDDTPCAPLKRGALLRVSSHQEKSPHASREASVVLPWPRRKRSRCKQPHHDHDQPRPGKERP